MAMHRFWNRKEAALLLAQKLLGRDFRDPLVLAIPRGGVAVGAVLAQELGADLDVVLSRKLRVPGQPELAIGAISEAGEVYLDHYEEEAAGAWADYLAEERRLQLALITKRQQLYRRVRPRAFVSGRTVIVTDDGIATGSTMISALKTVQAQTPFELIVAVPVAAPDRLEEIRRWCDEVICLIRPERLYSIGRFYVDFSQVDDREVLELLRPFANASPADSERMANSDA
jgi:predicted phosphoribosyltransferase